MIWSGGKMFDTIKKWGIKYWNWIMGSPGAILLVAVLIPSVMIFGLVAVSDSHLKTKCLDSQLARRWSPTDSVCEEYHDGEWIEADLSGANIYYYNNAASREH
jgi:hypothetical protein